MRALTLSVVALTALGCSSADPMLAGAPPRADAGVAPDSSAPPDANLPAGEPTYHGLVDDILARHCWGCHSSAGGGIAPFDLDTYPSAAPEAALIAAATSTRTMPPFFAVNDGSCQPIQDHGGWLRDDEITILRLWAEHGAPEGDPTTTPPTVMAPPHLDAPDVTLTMSQPFTPQLRGTDPNEIRCFVVDPHLTTDAFISSYEVLPGTASVVHHVIVYEPESDANAASAAAMEGTDGRIGYACNGGTVVPAHPVALWAPGAHRTDYPANTGLSLPAGRRLILQIHYNLANGIAADQTSVRFATVGSVTHPAQMLLLSQSSLTLPPHELSVLSTPRSRAVPGAGTIWGVFPHMHTTGRHLSLTLQHAGATSCLVDVERWNFNWQQPYFYTTPISVAATDHISIQCEYDTMSRDVTTTYGEGTESEMCLSFFYVTGP